jgi:Zn-dependent protease with chaperone function
MTMKNKIAYYALMVFFVLSLVSLNIGLLCCWLIFTGPHHQILRHLAAGAVAFGIGLAAVTFQIYRTIHYVARLASSRAASVPAALLAATTNTDLDPSSITVILSPVPLAFCAGFLHPRIHVSSGLIEQLTLRQLQAVLLHEEYHRQRRDPLRLLLVEGAHSALFFLPAVNEWASIVKTGIEIEADRFAINQVGRPALAGALHSLLSYPSTPAAAAPASIAGLSASSIRISSLLEDRRPWLRISTRGLVFSTLLIWALCIVLML